MTNIKNIIGMKFGKLTVLKISDTRGNRGQIKYDCVCDCGNNHTVTGEAIRSGKSKSCGCYKNTFKTRNFNHDRESQIWKRLYSSTIIKRSKNKGWKDWLSLFDFIELSKKECFYCNEKPFIEIKDYISEIKKDISVKVYSNGIDRIDNNIGYVKNNCVSCCKYCNFAKNTMSIEEFKIWVDKVYLNLNKIDRINNFLINNK